MCIFRDLLWHLKYQLKMITENKVSKNLQKYKSPYIWNIAREKIKKREERQFLERF